MAGGWKDVESALGAEKAAELRKTTEAELSRGDFVSKALKAMSCGEAVQHGAEALFVLGPSAAGKSYALTHGSLQVPSKALDLDGDMLREASDSWKQALQLAESKGLAGFSDFFTGYFKKPMDEVKKRIVESAIGSRMNLKVPDTASNVDKTKQQIDTLVDAGYSLRFVAVYADKEVCEVRGTRRESANGKKYSGNNWLKSVRAILQVQEYLEEKGLLEKSGGGVQVLNNTDTLRPMSLEEVRKVVEEAAGQAGVGSQSLSSDLKAGEVLHKGGWCETRLLAGHYKSTSGEEELEVVPANLEDEQVDVSIKRLSAGEASDNSWVFDVESCAIRTRSGQAVYALKVDAEGKPTLHASPGQPPNTFEQVTPLTGMCLAFPITRDTAFRTALDGSDFCQSPFRALTEEEFQQAGCDAGLVGPGAAPAREKPRAMYVVAPSGGGKTHVMTKLSGAFGIKTEEAVSIDSAVFRSCHPQYRAIIHNGRANHGIWSRAWPAAKGSLSKAKSRLQKDAMANKQDMLISDTGHDSAKLLKNIGELQAAGYEVNFCGIFAEPKEIMARGLARELDDGKRYNRDMDKLMETFRAFSPAIKAINGQFWIVANLLGRQPEVYLQGTGGRELEFNLKAALAVVQGQAEETYVDPKDISYVAEGNMNMVCAHVGTSKTWEGKILRCRKVGSSGDYSEDLAFAKQVMVRALSEAYVDAGELVAITPENAKAIDDAVFASRPANRQAKRLDVNPRQNGHVLALRLDNLLAAPLRAMRTVSVEIKVKCGLRERLGLPTRFRLLQQEKLKTGKISKISEYDPIKMLSKDPKLVYEAVTAAFEEPQNNLRIFIDGKTVFNDTKRQKADASTVNKVLNEKLQEAGMPGGVEAFFGYMSAAMSSKSMQLPERLKRIQCWAAGETEKLVHELYALLLRKVGEEKTARLLYQVKTHEAAVDGIEDLPCDEAGIVAAVQAMDSTLHRAGTATEWTRDIESEVLMWICRYLIGRTAHDVSVILNFAVKPSGGLSKEQEDTLRAHRYAPLELIGVPNEEKWTGLWTRASVVDTDMKSAKKIPEYATQFEDYAKVYYERFEFVHACKDKDQEEEEEDAGNGDAQGAESKGEAVGGHANSILFEEGTVWKKDQGGDRGQQEFAFLRWALSKPETVGLIPRLVGYRVIGTDTLIGMENALAAFEEPSVLDIKMGTRTYSPSASPEKAANQARKAAESTSGSLGLRVVGGKVRTANGSFAKYGTKTDHDIVDEAGVRKVLAEMLPTQKLKQAAKARIDAIGKWWSSQTDYSFYASSLLLACDTPNGEDCKVFLIDFANCERITRKTEDLSGFQTGLDTLARVFKSFQD